MYATSLRTCEKLPDVAFSLLLLTFLVGSAIFFLCISHKFKFSDPSLMRLTFLKYHVYYKV